MYLEFDKNQGSLYQRFLLTPKLFVFFYSSSLGCLLPFLPIFFRLNGLSAVQNGVLMAIRYLILSWSAPALVFVASKINCRKMVLVSAVILGALANMGFLFTAQYKHSSRPDCMKMNESENLILNMTVDSNINFQHAILTRFNYSHQDNQEFVGFGEERGGDRGQKYFKSMFNSTREIERDVFYSTGFKLDKIFLTFLVIVVVTTFLSSPAKPLHEIVSHGFIKEHKASYNIQRLCGCMGWSILSFVVAVVVSRLPCSFHLSKNVFDLHFGFHMLFATTATIFAVVMKSPSLKGKTKFRLCRVLKGSCQNPNIVVAVFAMAILGTAQSAVSSYLFWYVQDLGGNELHMGLIMLVSGLSQIPALFLYKYFIHWLGHGWMFFLSMSAFAARFLLYSYVNDPLFVIPVELLHCLTSSSIWFTSMSLAVLVAPIGFERSMQNLFTASYYGLGMGFGGILTSIAYQLYGPVLVFKCAAAVCATYSLLMAVLQCLLSSPDETHGFPLNGDYYKTGAGKNNQSDWLLEALNAEEEEVHYSRS